MNRMVVLVAVFFAGCEAPVSLESYCRELVVAECQAQQRCGRISSAFDCSSREPVSDCLSGRRVGLANGVLQYDGVAASACITEIGSSSCENIQWTALISLPSCLAVFHGVAKQGETCGTCAAGLRCLTSGTSCGTCEKVSTPPRVLLREGEACAPAPVDNRVCAAGLRCLDAVCVREPVANEACGEIPCVLGAACVEGLCVAWAEAGEPCGPVGCKAGLFCSSAATCEVEKPLGAACDAVEQCASFLCSNGVCTVTRGEGQTCGLGAPCDFEFTCLDGVCAARAQNGEACEPRGCANSALCVDGTCWDPMLECR